MISQYQPLGDRIIVKENVKETTTSFGLVLVATKTNDEKTFEATVVSVGPEVKDVEAGNIVIIPTGAGIASADEDGEKIIVVPMEYVLGVYE